ncbi:MAG: DUF1870 family protein [Rubrivivax sp.]|nr:DUF1870 family protein [Rubrivivax sp.]MDP3612110.1 DUF1870 family protein [Rubrivivax sp.]
MNAPELQALRRLLFFSVAEAARYLAADEQRPSGVEERTWNRWEAGKVPVPANIASTVRQAVQYRASAIEAMCAQLAQASASAGQTETLVFIWYAEVDDWPHAPVLWRPAQSALASCFADPAAEPVHLVAFDARAFNLWRIDQGLADTADVRSAWAALQPAG